MVWREANGVDYIFGLAKNQRLVKAIAAEIAQAREESNTRDRPNANMGRSGTNACAWPSWGHHRTSRLGQRLRNRRI
jgi:hypothetical protein